jgi:hypothetical protein
MQDFFFQNTTPQIFVEQKNGYQSRNELNLYRVLDRNKSRFQISFFENGNLLQITVNSITYRAQEVENE